MSPRSAGLLRRSPGTGLTGVKHKWTKLVKRGHLQELRKVRDNKQVLKIIRSVRNTNMADYSLPST